MLDNVATGGWALGGADAHARRAFAAELVLAADLQRVAQRDGSSVEAAPTSPLYIGCARSTLFASMPWLLREMPVDGLLVCGA